MMANHAPLTLFDWVALPVFFAVLAALAAVMHYSAAVASNARDLPNLPTAIIGGAVAGFVATLAALIVWRLIGSKPWQPFFTGIGLSCLGGEYLGGRCEEVVPAIRMGLLAVVILLPLGTGIVGALSP
jgi:hypothetical protein